MDKSDIKFFVKGFIKWLLIVLVTLNIIVWSVAVLHCQTHPKHDNDDIEETIGFKSVIFMSKDDNNIYWKKETKTQVTLGSFGYDKYTKFYGPVEGRLCVAYCKTHLFAYVVERCQEVKNGKEKTP